MAFTRSGAPAPTSSVSNAQALANRSVQNANRLGPSLPAFLSPNILNFLVENYGIAPITTPEEDIKALLNHSK